MPPESQYRALQHQHWPETADLDDHSLYRKVKPLADALAPGTMAEIGFTNGNFLRYLAGRGWRAVGVDLDPRGFRPAVQADASSGLPIASRSLDLLVAVEVIEHIPNTAPFLAECRRVLRPGGRLILTTPNLLFWVNRVRMLVGRAPLFAYADYHLHMFVWPDLEEKVAEQFVIDRVTGSHVLHGVARNRALGDLWARLGDRAPRLAAHLVVQAHRPR